MKTIRGMKLIWRSVKITYRIRTNLYEGIDFGGFFYGLGMGVDPLKGPMGLWETLASTLLLTGSQQNHGNVKILQTRSSSFQEKNASGGV